MPKTIKYKDQTYEYYKNDYSYFDEFRGDYGERVFLSDWIQFSSTGLNDEIEVIEEQQDIDIQAIEELDVDDLKIYKLYDTNTNETNDVFDTSLGIKINKLIKAVKQLDRREGR